MPCEYNAAERKITLQTELVREPRLTIASLIHGVVTDLLTQNQFGAAHITELVELATVGTGLGALRSGIDLVNQGAPFWDTTRWDLFTQPFLSSHTLAYASAVAAWVRGERDPAWSAPFSGELKGPMKKSLKFLNKTGDSFFSEAQNASGPPRSQEDWISVANQTSVSSQIIALRHFDFSEPWKAKQESILEEKLRSSNREILLYAICAAEQLTPPGLEIVGEKQRNPSEYFEPIVNELRFLSENRDDQLQAKAMFAIARLRQMNDASVVVAGKLLASPAKFVVFAGIAALASLDQVPQSVLPAVDRRFKQSLQTCDYEFVKLFASAYDRWMEDPVPHFEQLLVHDSPEYFQIAQDALENAREELVTLKD